MKAHPVSFRIKKMGKISKFTMGAIFGLLCWPIPFYQNTDGDRVYQAS
jgi:hypothetical protein